MRFERRPGQKEARWGLAGPFARRAGATADSERGAPPERPSSRVARAADDELAARVARIERDLAELREVVARLREVLD